MTGFLIGLAKGLGQPMLMFILHALSKLALPATWHVALFRDREWNGWAFAAALAFFWMPIVIAILDDWPPIGHGVLLSSVIAFMVWRACVTAARGGQLVPRDQADRAIRKR